MSEPIKIDGIGVEDLQNFDVEGYSDEDALVLSEGLLREALPCLDTIYPTFTAAQKTTIKFAVLEMARHLQIEAHNLDHTSSAMQSESLGSYSYSKAQRSVREGEATSVPAFDRAVGQFAHLCTIENGDGPVTSKSEEVFESGFDTFRANYEYTRRDPYFRWGSY